MVSNQEGPQRPGLSRPPKTEWTVVGARRTRTGRQQELTMSDIMEGNVNLKSDSEEDLSGSHYRRGEDTRMRDSEVRISERQNNTEGVVCYNCDGKGHMARVCDQPKKTKRCHRCREEGHLIRDCRVAADTQGQSCGRSRIQRGEAGRPSQGEPGTQRQEETTRERPPEGVRMRRKWLFIKLRMPKTRMMPNEMEVANICRKLFNKDDLLGVWGEKEGITVWLKQGADLTRYESERKLMIGDSNSQTERPWN